MNDDLPTPQMTPPPYAKDTNKEPITGVHDVPGPPNTLPTKGRRWYPNPQQIVALSILVGGLAALIDVLSADLVTTKIAVLAFCKGAIAQLMVYMGMRSAGPKPW